LNFKFATIRVDLEFRFRQMHFAAQTMLRA